MTASVDEKALQSTPFIDADSAFIRAYAEKHAGGGSDIERAVRLYYAVRDDVHYDLNAFGIEPERFVASHCLQAASAFCVPKAIALAAVARAAGIPARVGFADVKNHLTSPRITELMDTDLFLWHAYSALLLDGKWVKATPAFDIAFCNRYGVKPLEFDGKEDSIFHEFDASGRKHMEYVNFHGEFDDMPLEEFSADMRKYYPRLLEALAGDQPTTARNA